MLSKKIPWASHSRSDSEERRRRDGQQKQEKSKNPKKEQSLITILSTPESRANLLMLVADCTDAMRRVIADTFDPDKTGFEEPEKPIEDKGRNEETEKVNEEAKTDEELAKERRLAEDAAKAEHERRVKELKAPKMQQLKEAALTYFDEWRDRVLGRVGHAINEKIGEEDETSESADANIEEDGEEIPQNSRAEQDPEHVDAETALDRLYPLQTTPLAKLSEAKRALLLHTLLLLLLSLEKYPAESRVLLLQIARSLHLPFTLLSEDESKVAQGLLEAAKKQMNADEETKKKAEEGTNARRWKVGLGAVAGAALIGITGGLAAPLLAAGVGTVMGGLGLGTTAAATYLGAMAGSAPLVGVLFGAYGGRMTSKAIDQYAKEISDFAFIPLHTPSVLTRLAKSDNDSRRLRVAIGISGYLNSETDVTRPWQVIASTIEAFSLRWELEALLNLGNALTSYIKSAAWALAKREIVKMTVFAALTAGLWPLGLAKASRVIDNPFTVARSRSEKAGEVLADALINKVQGERPVTLVGYSLGSRVIYSCLLSLADRHAFGLIEQVIFIGSPVPSNSVAWRKLRSVVSGRVINVYSTNDYLLGYLYRTSSLQYGIAGLQRVKDVEGVENVDVSDLVQGHTRYRLLTGRILKKIGFEDLDLVEVSKEDKELKIEEQAEEQERRKKESAGRNVEGEVDDLRHEVEQTQISPSSSPVPPAQGSSGEVSEKFRSGNEGNVDDSQTSQRSPPLPPRRTPHIS